MTAPSFKISEREEWFYQRGYRDAWNAALEQAATVAGRHAADSAQLAAIDAAILGLKEPHLRGVQAAHERRA